MIHYRRAMLSDIPQLIKLRIDFLREVAQPATEITIAGPLEDYFKIHLLAGDYINWLALDGDNIVSTAGMCIYSIPPNFVNVTGKRAYILNVYTEKDYRRQGISKVIFGKLMQEAHERQISQISLHATAEGRGLYEQFGLKPRDNEMVWGNHL